MKKILLLVVMTLLLVSCNREDDVVRSSFQGVWSGIYQGNDSGTWKVNVAEDGSITGW